MPYIAPKDRKELDPLIDQLAEKIVKQSKDYGNDGAFAGLINYACTRLTLKVIKMLFGQMRYWILALVRGNFEEMSFEFRRRLGDKYEDKQIEKNGDVDLYKEFEDDIKKG
ncbi:MAG: hypothetical protein UY12_C0029G0004 [Parcubacteria group bacterium GW2011_GWA2_47_8b]|uniref:Uncharacterized protein n=3 Tax=Parcubacteria group TaxID=1794811 RepID=A0A0G1W1E1_9BACT|nr:MAG: hypothetical protein UY02_C0033G0017 [Candidatus Giovannonibacteria bacterium GW2011_GWB1_47_6b]KKU83857.1 MAG: hypothetical protein UY12_C0029G0004 [Parcubacteria group bacterium GW2011_GWA2_47_8b]KKU95150.1 MAG: hypothetical protein UY24_C0003G0008 [Parcubacteria group bacterium GW2011_GWA1_48_11b]OGY63710.1 MAG: hypothetical protein A3E64_01080 [Candidatus Harrisonbacteria bacterium RIFCSPHIGHO2_12_FULL_48_16]OGY68424.1 MAG: hypothetical protein A2214_01200 [Candidatus Harrisonbacter